MRDKGLMDVAKQLKDFLSKGKPTMLDEKTYKNLKKMNTKFDKYLARQSKLEKKREKT